MNPERLRKHAFGLEGWKPEYGPGGESAFGALSSGSPNPARFEA